MAELIFPQSQIKAAVHDVALKIRDSGFRPDLMLVVMNGGLRFGSDLSERLHFYYINPEISFITGIGETPAFIEGRQVLLVDDIFDTGKTMTQLRQELSRRDASIVRTAALIYRERVEEPQPDFFGLRLSSMHWLYGYGLDLEGRERGNPNIYGISPGA